MFTLPEEQKAMLMFLITAGIKAALKQFGVELSGKGALIVAALVGALLYFGEGLLAQFPEAQGPVLAILSALAIILSGFGIHYTIKESVVNGFKA